MMSHNNHEKTKEKEAEEKRIFEELGRCKSNRFKGRLILHFDGSGYVAKAEKNQFV